LHRAAHTPGAAAAAGLNEEAHEATAEAHDPCVGWNTISGSPFYEVAQPWMKDYVYNAIR